MGIRNEQGFFDQLIKLLHDLLKGRMVAFNLHETLTDLIVGSQEMCLVIQKAVHKPPT